MPWRKRNFSSQKKKEARVKKSIGKTFAQKSLIKTLHKNFFFN